MSFALRALIFGYTGETAKALIKVLAQDPRYSSVKLVGRREADVDYGGIDTSEASKKFKLHVIDFDRLDDHPSLFEEVDVGFSLLGTTRTKSNKEQYRIIDHDYAVRLAELALNAGCKEYYVVTSAGANANSWSSYLRLKGEIERDVTAVGVFPNHVAFYRAGGLICDRAEPRLGERLLMGALKYVSPSHTVHIDTLARALANGPFCLAKKMRKVDDGADSRVLVVENQLLTELAADSTGLEDDGAIGDHTTKR